MISFMRLVYFMHKDCFFILYLLFERCLKDCMVGLREVGVLLGDYVVVKAVA